MLKQHKPLSIIYNEKSGFHASSQAEFYEQIVNRLSKHGFEIQSFEISS